MAAISRALIAVYSRFEPGGVSSARVISERSLSGMKPPPPKSICRAMAPKNETATMHDHGQRGGRAPRR